MLMVSLFLRTGIPIETLCDQGHFIGIEMKGVRMMPEIKPHTAPQSVTRRAIANVIWMHDHDREPNPLGNRAHSAFPLTLTVGLMTIGVILLISLLQLLTGYVG